MTGCVLPVEVATCERGWPGRCSGGGMWVCAEGEPVSDADACRIDDYPAGSPPECDRDGLVVCPVGSVLLCETPECYP